MKDNEEKKRKRRGRIIEVSFLYLNTRKSRFKKRKKKEKKI